MRGGIVVIEGADGTGKTSLIDALVDWRDDAIVMKSGPPGDNPYLEYATAIERAIDAARNGKIVLIDRLHLGEAIYGPLLRGKSGLSIDEVRTLSARLDSACAVRLVLDCSDSAIFDRLMRRDGGMPDPKSGAKLEHSAALLAMFRSWAKVDNWTVVNSSSVTTRQLCNAVISMLRPVPRNVEVSYGCPVMYAVKLVEVPPLGSVAAIAAWTRNRPDVAVLVHTSNSLGEVAHA